MEIPWEIVTVVASIVAVLIATYFFGKRISQTVEMRAEREERLRYSLRRQEELMEKLQAKFEKTTEALKAKEKEIEHLESELEEVKKNISVTQQRLKFMESLAKEDIRTVSERVEELTGKLDALFSQLIEMRHYLSSLERKMERK